MEMFQGVNEIAPVQLTAINARTIWATLIPEGDVTVHASIGGTTADGGTQLTVGYIEIISGLRSGETVVLAQSTKASKDSSGGGAP